MRVLMVGLEGFSHGLAKDLILAGRLPVISSLAGRGSVGALTCPPPVAPLPSWTTILSGVNPGRHGQYDFTRREGYQIRFCTGDRREAPNLFEMLSALDRTVVAVGFPGTFPAVRVRGAMLAGWDSPAAAGGSEQGCHPTSLHEDLVSTFGPRYLPVQPVEMVQDPGPAWYRETAGRLVETIGRRIELAMHVSENLPGGAPDLLAVHFSEADTAGHHFWHLHDLNSPRRPEWIEDFLDPATGRVADPVAQVYSALDSAVGELAERFGPDVVLVCSDHGMGGTGGRTASVNRLLAMEGFLRVQEGTGQVAEAMIQAARQVGRELFPADVREELASGMGSVVGTTLESRLRFAGMDFYRTTAFSEDLSHAPAVHLNQLGRDPAGVIHASERTWWMQMVVDALTSWEADSPPGQIPPGPRRVVRAVHVREELYRGPHVERFPDLVVEMDDDAGYSYHMAPGLFRSMDSAVEQTVQPAVLPGAHRPDGVFLVARTDHGEDVKTFGGVDGMEQTSVAPLVLELMGFRAPGYFDTEPPRVTDQRLEWLDEHFLLQAYEKARGRPAESTNEEGALRQRLRDLGYL